MSTTEVTPALSAGLQTTDDESSRVLDPAQVFPFDKKRVNVDLLSQPVDPNKIRIRPDGLIYLPNVEYRKVLTAVFGPGGWAIFPVQHWPDKSAVYYEGRLFASGRFVGQAVGEHYFDPKQGDGYSTSVESAKSDCLTRCCKDLGIASELWDPDFVRQFKDDYCVPIWVEGNPRSKVSGESRQFWRLKKDPLYDVYPWKETGVAGNKPSGPSKASKSSGGSSGRGESKTSSGAKQTAPAKTSRPFAPSDLVGTLRAKAASIAGREVPDLMPFEWTFGVLLATSAVNNPDLAVGQGDDVLSAVVDVFFDAVFGPGATRSEGALSVLAWLGLSVDKVAELYGRVVEGESVDLQVDPVALSELSSWLKSPGPGANGNPFEVEIASLLVD